MDITLPGVLIGVFALAIGLGLVFRGFKLFMLILPLLGLILWALFGPKS